MYLMHISFRTPFFWMKPPDTASQQAAKNAIIQLRKKQTKHQQKNNIYRISYLSSVSKVAPFLLAGFLPRLGLSGAVMSCWLWTYPESLLPLGSPIGAGEARLATTVDILKKKRCYTPINVRKTRQKLTDLSPKLLFAMNLRMYRKILESISADT